MITVADCSEIAGKIIAFTRMRAHTQTDTQAYIHDTCTAIRNDFVMIVSLHVVCQTELSAML